MELNIVFKNIEPTDALKAYFEKKGKKLERIFKKDFEIKAIFSTEKFRQKAEVIVNIEGNIIKAEESSDDMYSAIDLVIDKIDRQAKKYREKIKDRKHHYTEENFSKNDSTFSTERQIVKTDNYVVKPLTVEEAALQLDASENGFIVFRNAETNGINVLYKKRDGNYGWIDPK